MILQDVTRRSHSCVRGNTGLHDRIPLGFRTSNLFDVFSRASPRLQSADDRSMLKQ
jgi:hypothetical protein